MSFFTAGYDPVSAECALRFDIVAPCAAVRRECAQVVIGKKAELNKPRCKPAPKVILALFTGMRRGEIVALRWRNVDLAGKMISVRESIEETKLHGPRFKTTKTKSGLRDISLPDIVVEALTDHRRQQLKQRLSLGLGKPPADVLVFPSFDGGPQYPRNLSGEWKEACALVGIDPPVTFHSLRHSHASQLIKAGVDVVTVSKRLGHANPQITLQVYAHLWEKRDDIAAAVINAAVSALIVTRS